MRHEPTGIRYDFTRSDQETGAAPLLLVSGIGSALEFWQVPLARGVAGARDVLAFDIPGFGLSPPVPDGLSLDRLCTATAQLVRDVVGGPVCVVGHSMGAYLALALAVRAPELVTEVIVVDGMIFTVDRFLHGDWRAAAHLGLMVNLAAQVIGGGFPAGPRVRRLLVSNPWVRRALLWSFLHRPGSVSPADLEIALTNAGSLSTWRILQTVRSTVELEGLVRAARRPVSLIYGGEDHMMRKADVATFSQLCPGALSIGIPDCGHWPMIEKPAEFKAALARVLGPTGTPGVA